MVEFLTMLLTRFYCFSFNFLNQVLYRNVLTNTFFFSFFLSKISVNVRFHYTTIFIVIIIIIFILVIIEEFQIRWQICVFMNHSSRGMLRASPLCLSSFFLNILIFTVYIISFGSL